MIPNLLPTGHLHSEHREKISVPNHHPYCHDTSITPACRAAGKRLRDLSPEAFSRVAHFQGGGDMLKAAVVEVIYKAHGKWTDDLSRTITVFIRDTRKRIVGKKCHPLDPECHVRPVASGKRLRGLQVAVGGIGV